MSYHFTEVSQNAKLGPIPVVTSTKNTCPTSCSFKGAGCYAEHGPLAIHWKRVSEGQTGGSLDELCSKISRLPQKQLWRYGQAGDLPGDEDKIDREGLLKLARANRGRPVIAYTHKPATPENLETLRQAAELGFHVNLSADNLTEADELMKTGHNVVTVLPPEFARQTKRGEWSESLSEYKSRTADYVKTTKSGKRIAICPATYLDVRCMECGVCANPGERNAVIGFPAHGTRKNKIKTGL